MGTQPSLDQIAQAVIQGIENAHKEYNNWSGGEWLSEAPEYMATVKIAQKLSQTDIGYVTLEQKIKSVSKESGSEKPPSKKSRPAGRCDIVIYYKNELPRAIIEVKNSHSNKGYYLDAKRIEGMLVEDTSLQLGILAGYICRYGKDSKASVKNVESRPEGMLKELKKQISNDLIITPVHGKVRSKEGYAWRAICFLIKR